MTSLQAGFDALLCRFGPQRWWPGDSPWETACGAVLTQNTNWRNVERAIAKLIEADALEPTVVRQMGADRLAELIRPAGYFNVKARRLAALAVWWLERAEWATAPTTTNSDLRESLLAVHGIGQETADSIMLYAFNRATFVVDAYTRRFLLRHRMIEDSDDYTRIKHLFERELPHDVGLFNEYHALIVRLGKDFCRTTPICEGCPLNAPSPR